MAVLHLTKDNFAEALQTEKTVLLDFWAPWSRSPPSIPS